MLVVAPVIEDAAFIVRGDANIGVGVRGIESESYLRLIALKEKIIAGHADLSSTDVVIGSDLAQGLGLNLTAPAPRTKPRCCTALTAAWHAVNLPLW